MGKRGRQRARGGQDEPAAVAGPRAGDDDLDLDRSYTDADGNQLVLRGVLTLKSRTRYTDTLHGGAHVEDAWQRAAELLFELLAVSWTINGVTTAKQKELLQRYRVASARERRFVRDSLREHLTQNFPELPAP
jgi:hypothetical protein